ncbi:MAG: hypothetical protein KF847_20390 [Pirellulales bacterium]|nr:hypothetical protein [Pirellulales bacterium]
MPAAIFTGQVVGKSGEVLFQRVLGAYWVYSVEGVQWWQGELTIESGEKPVLMDGVRLKFDDGRWGVINISRFRMPSPVVEFTGVGSPPE